MTDIPEYPLDDLPEFRDLTPEELEAALKYEEGLSKQMAKLEPLRKKSQSANWDWIRLNIKRNSSRMSRFEMPLASSDEEDAQWALRLEWKRKHGG